MWKYCNLTQNRVRDPLGEPDRVTGIAGEIDVRGRKIKRNEDKRSSRRDGSDVHVIGSLTQPIADSYWSLPRVPCPDFEFAITSSQPLNLIALYIL